MMYVFVEMKRLILIHLLFKSEMLPRKRLITIQTINEECENPAQIYELNIYVAFLIVNELILFYMFLLYNVTNI